MKAPCYILSYISCLAMLMPYTLSQDNNSTTGGICSLTGFQNMNPFPSLIKCYKYNSDSCCTSVHDDFVTNYISNLLTNSCVRKYRELEDFVCYGCNPHESIYTNAKSKVLNFCLSYALNLWNGTVAEDLNKPSTRFDNCGIKVGDGSPSALKSLTDKPYIIPSETFSDFYSFVNAIGVPFFDNFTVNVIDDTNVTDPTNLCFAGSNYLKGMNYVHLILFLLLSLIYYN